jgi:formate--tetrahydrofolate ligase
LATNLADLKERLGSILVAYTRDRTPVYARDLKADGAMAVLLKDALMPNLVQTLENNPVFVHGGPFANIAHGCNSALATKTALKLADYVVTEAGFGADLGAEKFFDIKCRIAGLEPATAVIVATVRALKMHGGVERSDLGAENVEAVAAGCANLGRHIANVRKFGVEPVVAINRFGADTIAEIEAVSQFAEAAGVAVFLCEHWSKGGEGLADLAEHVADLADRAEAKFSPLYADDLPLWNKIERIATELYGAAGAVAEAGVAQRLKDLEAAGYGNLPICMAKTQYSFTTDPKQLGAPSGHTVPVREVILAAGARFVIAVCGEIMRMPGLPRTPSAEHIDIADDGTVTGLF